MEVSDLVSKDFFVSPGESGMLLAVAVDRNVGKSPRRGTRNFLGVLKYNGFKLGRQILLL